MLSFVVLLISCSLHIVTIAVMKEATITPNNPVNDIDLSTRSGSVQSTSTEWKVTFVSQEGYDLLLSLNNNYGFDPINPSIITLTLNGTNYNTAEGDLLLVFSVSNLQYFAVVIRTEISSQLYKIYPQSYSDPLSQVNVQQMISRSSPDRWNRITKNDSWHNTIPVYKNPTGEGTKWPIQITIVNDPITNTVRYSQHDIDTNTELYSATFLTSFAPNNGMDVHMMTDGEDESFGIYDFHITYDIEWVFTNKPTSAPTVITSASPTTLAPTTFAPSTLFPTYFPSISPTELPIVSSTTTVPTTSIPTAFPTFIPTTISSTNQPSDSTTNSPTNQNTISVQQETVKTNKNTNIIITEFIDDGIDFIVVHSNHNDIAIVSVLAACIGSVFCIFTLVLLCCCIQSQRHRATINSNKVKYHKPKINELDIAVIASAANANPVPVHHVYPMENQSEATVSPSIDSRPLKSEEEKEGELMTVNGVGVEMSDLMKYDTASVISKFDTASVISSKQIVHDVNVHTIIDYDKMERYLNDEMSSSSQENILEERR